MDRQERANRRSHSKSRGGCFSCKRRHVKCDESRPACVNCLTAHRRCPYLDEHSTRPSATSSIPPSPSAVESLQSSPPLKLPSNEYAPPFIQLRIENQGQALLQVELLQQWLTATSSTCIGDTRAANLFAASAMDTGLRYPLVMHSILAISALHLSWTLSERREFLLDKARELQEEGLASFKQLDVASESRLVVPSLLFSFITGVHRLCHVLAYCRTDFKYFLSSFVGCMSLLRGVSVVVTGRMDMVRDSELAPLLVPARSSAPPTKQGRRALAAVDALKSLYTSTGVHPETAATLEAAITDLQSLYEEPMDNCSHSVGGIAVWMMKASARFTEMLADRSPSALVVLAHAAPLLRRKHKCWAVGTSPSFLVEAVADSIPSAWHKWLEWPLESCAGFPGD